MRLLFLSDDPDDPTVGASKAPRKLALALERLGHHCEFLHSADLGLRPRSERLRFAASPWLARRALRHAWRERGPFDIVDAAAAEAAWLPHFAGAAVVARSHGLEHLYYQALLDDHRAGLLHKRWWRRVWYPAARLSQVARGYRRARAAIVLNQRERDFICRRGWKSADQICVVPHGLDPDRLQAAPHADALRGKGLLFSGAWYTGKGVHYMAQALRLLVERGLAIPLTILGPGVGGDFAAVETYVRRDFAPASQSLLTVLPRTSDENEIYRHYREHDLLVCPSTAEGFGMVVFEALSQRLPVVCSASVGAAEWLRHGESVWIVPARDAAALADAIGALWHDPPRRAALGEAGYQAVRPYTWERAALATLAVYERAREGK